MIFELSIGPVQRFIGQARRTRDFWAGSFLLSWLSGVALCALRKHEPDAQILIPHVPPDSMTWMTERGRAPPSDELRIAALPNHFRAEVNPRSFTVTKAETIATDVREAFVSLAQLVWVKDVLPLWTPGRGADWPALEDVRSLWERQTENWFEIMWTLSERPALSARKNWRSHARPAEPGAKCTLMGDLQVLSCADGARGEELDGAMRNARRASFWHALRSRVGQLDLPETEELCSIALVKRRFARYFVDLHVTLRSGLQLSGAQLSEAVPSTAALAAAPWLAKQIQSLTGEQIEHLKSRIPRGSVVRLEPLQCVLSAVNDAGSLPVAQMDARLWFTDRAEDDEEYSASEVSAFIKARRHVMQSKPAPYFAVLRMDVDHAGLAGSMPESAQALARALANYSDKAQATVRARSGYLVYSGGDDQLALLPVNSALTCAAELRAHFQAAIAAECGSASFDVAKMLAVVTLSSSLIFAHHRTPLTYTLDLSVNALKDDVKAGAGRDAIGIVVSKPGGIAARWAIPWDGAFGSELHLGGKESGVTNHSDHQLVLAEIASRISRLPEPGVYSSRFLYKLPTVFELAPLPSGSNPQEIAEAIDHAEVLAASEYLSSFIRNHPTFDEARQIVRPLLLQSCQWRRQAFAADGNVLSPPRFELSSPVWRHDAALIVRFLATHESEEG